jgi:hypothetical protein
MGKILTQSEFNAAAPTWTTFIERASLSEAQASNNGRQLYQTSISFGLKTYYPAYPNGLPALTQMFGPVLTSDMLSGPAYSVSRPFLPS